MFLLIGFDQTEQTCWLTTQHSKMSLKNEDSFISAFHSFLHGFTYSSFLSFFLLLILNFFLLDWLKDSDLPSAVILLTRIFPVKHIKDTLTRAQPFLPLLDWESDEFYFFLFFDPDNRNFRQSRFRSSNAFCFFLCRSIPRFMIGHHDVWRTYALTGTRARPFCTDITIGRKN